MAKLGIEDVEDGRAGRERRSNQEHDEGDAARLRRDRPVPCVDEAVVSVQENDEPDRNNDPETHRGDDEGEQQW